MNDNMSSKPAQHSRKWLWTGLLIGFLNPVFSGIILGLLYLSEESFKKEGKIVLAFSVVWGALVLVLIQKFQAQGILPML